MDYQLQKPPVIQFAITGCYSVRMALGVILVELYVIKWGPRVVEFAPRHYLPSITFLRIYKR